MRPGVYASVMRDRKTGTRRVNPQPHVYSWRRFFIMISVGALLFVPGLIVTIIGIESSEEVEDVPSDKVLYKFIGPVAVAAGTLLLCASGLYYACWGFQSPVRRPHGKHGKKGKKHGEHYDPLQHRTKQRSEQRSIEIPVISTIDGVAHISYEAKSVPAISNHNASSSVRSTGSPSSKRSPRGSGDKVYSYPSTPEARSGHGHHNHHHHTSHRTASKNSIDTASVRSHHNSNSRHRSSSHSSHSHQPHSTSTSPPHSRVSHQDNQVAFVNTDAPLAQGESGSMVTIDIESGIEEAENRY